MIPPPHEPARRRFSKSRILVSALCLLVLVACGLGIQVLLRDSGPENRSLKSNIGALLNSERQAGGKADVSGRLEGLAGRSGNLPPEPADAPPPAQEPLHPYYEVHVALEILLQHLTELADGTIRPALSYAAGQSDGLPGLTAESAEPEPARQE